MDDSIVVIQCAASKQPDAGYLQTGNGRKVMFVAQPDLAPENADYIYARPDGRADTGLSWRQESLGYDREPADNPLGLLPAWRLYENQAYGLLYRKYGPENLYILSAGWGLIRADFLTPNYDITFTSVKKDAKHKQRYKRDKFKDFRMLPDDTNSPVIFFGGQKYVPQFCELTSRVQGPRHVFYNLVNPPDAPGCQLHRFETRIRINWHYEAARAYVEGHINI
jgi:hypothetical protein